MISSLPYGLAAEHMFDDGLACAIAKPGFFKVELNQNGLPAPICKTLKAPRPGVDCVMWRIPASLDVRRWKKASAPTVLFMCLGAAENPLLPSTEIRVFRVVDVVPNVNTAVASDTNVVGRSRHCRLTPDYGLGW